MPNTQSLSSEDYDSVGPLIIVGPILVLAGVGFLALAVELIIRVRKQIQRVMDPNLLKTNNFHEVKHWIEPGEGSIIVWQVYRSFEELVAFGWGQFNIEEERTLLDEQNLRTNNGDGERAV